MASRSFTRTLKYNISAFKIDFKKKEEKEKPEIAKNP